MFAQYISDCLVAHAPRQGGSLLQMDQQGHHRSGPSNFFMDFQTCVHWTKQKLLQLMHCILGLMFSFRNYIQRASAGQSRTLATRGYMGVARDDFCNPTWRVHVYYIRVHTVVRGRRTLLFWQVMELLRSWKSFAMDLTPMLRGAMTRRKASSIHPKRQSTQDNYA